MTFTRLVVTAVCMLMFLNLTDAASKKRHTPRPIQSDDPKWNAGKKVCCVKACNKSVFSGHHCRACGNHVHTRCSEKKDFRTSSEDTSSKPQWVCNDCIPKYVWGAAANEKLMDAENRAEAKRVAA